MSHAVPSQRPWGDCTLGEAGTRVARALLAQSTVNPPPASRLSARSREHHARPSRRSRVTASASDDSDPSDPPDAARARRVVTCTRCGHVHPAVLADARIAYCGGVLTSRPRVVIAPLELEAVAA